MNYGITFKTKEALESFFKCSFDELKRSKYFAGLLGHHVLLFKSPTGFEFAVGYTDYIIPPVRDIFSEKHACGTPFMIIECDRPTISEGDFFYDLGCSAEGDPFIDPLRYNSDVVYVPSGTNEHGQSLMFAYSLHNINDCTHEKVNIEFGKIEFLENLLGIPMGDKTIDGKLIIINFKICQYEGSLIFNTLKHSNSNIEVVATTKINSETITCILNFIKFKFINKISTDQPIPYLPRGLDEEALYEILCTDSMINERADDGMKYYDVFTIYNQEKKEES